MRCKNCGWPNEPDVSRCVKCNAPLSGSMVDLGRQVSSNEISEEPLKTTLRESSSNGGAQYNPENVCGNANTCPKCGYPVTSGMSTCPMCQSPLSVGSNNEQRPFNKPNHGGGRPNAQGGTINPWETPTEDSFCTLKRIPWQNEHVQYEPVSYSGQSIVLNRANTDSNNNSITSHIQAIISHENGEWYIEDKSALKTTLVRVDRKMKLEDSDIIVLGNRMFEFKKG